MKDDEIAKEIERGMAARFTWHLPPPEIRLEVSVLLNDGQGPASAYTRLVRFTWGHPQVGDCRGQVVMRRAQLVKEPVQTYLAWKFTSVLALTLRSRLSVTEAPDGCPPHFDPHYTVEMKED